MQWLVNFFLIDSVLKSLKKSKTIPEESVFLTSLFSIITNSESLIELMMLHYSSGDKDTSARWKAVVWIEIVKYERQR
jgi:hypothetical protein